MLQPEPRRIVIAGAGHAALLALTELGQPPPGAAITLVSRGEAAHYSGMVPGWIEGRYRRDEMSVPLAPFAASRGITWISAEIAGADAGHLFLSGGRALPFDTLIVNAGSQTALPRPLDYPAVIPVKPFEALIAGLESHLATAAAFAIVGAGIAGTEIALAIAARRPDAAVTLLERGPTYLPGLPRRFARAVRRTLGARGVRLRLGAEVNGVVAGALLVSPAKGRAASAQDETVPADAIIAVTGPSPPAWLAHTPFERTGDGYLAVDAAMRSLSHPDILAVGDAATRPDDPRPKAGVFSVRSGPPLAAAIRRLAAGEPLTPVSLQRRALILLGVGEQVAIGTRNGITWKGRWVWHLKDRLDRAFVQRLKQAPKV